MNQVKLSNRPEELPFGVEQLLKWLDAAIPRQNLRPGDDVAAALYQSGARDLVDELIRIYTEDNDDKAAGDESWYADDPVTRKFIEGGDW